MLQRRIRLLKEVNTVEISDVELRNKYDFFKFYKPVGSVNLQEGKL
jgi:hypothetical protein